MGDPLSRLIKSVSDQLPINSPAGSLHSKPYIFTRVQHFAQAQNPEVASGVEYRKRGREAEAALDCNIYIYCG